MGSAQKELNHEPRKVSNGRIFLDISTIKDPNMGKKQQYKKNWRILVDEQTNLKFSDFFETKDGMVEPTLEQFYRWEKAGMPVQIISCDGAGENIKLQQRSQSADWKMNIQFEFTPRNTTIWLS